jgi:multiple antibiotic resistance protein
VSGDVVSAFVTLFVVIDPLGIVPLFVGLTPGMSAADRRRMAVKGTIIGAGILFAFALVGRPLLEALGIGIPAFRIAGGILLLLLAIDMVMARHSGLRDTTDDEKTEGTARDDISVFPLAIPLIAGPGALTSIVLLMGRAEGEPGPTAMVLGLTAVVLLITLLCLLAATMVMRLLGTTGVNVVTRVFGVVTAALAVQFVIDGVRAVLPTG